MKKFLVVFTIGMLALIAQGCASKAKKAGNFVSTNCQMVCDVNECNQVCTRVEGTLEYKKR